MSPQQKFQLDEIKSFYSSSLENLLFKCMDEFCQFDPNDVRALISELWFYDFLPKNTDLDDETRKEIMTLFEGLIEDLETSHHNKKAYIKF